jgi:hypothetical protein
MVRIDCEYFTQVALYAAREYLTASKNHVVLNLVMRIEKAFIPFFRALKQKFTAKKRYKVWSYDRRRIAREVGPGAEDAIWADVTEVPTAMTRAALRA